MRVKNSIKLSLIFVLAFSYNFLLAQNDVKSHLLKKDDHIDAGNVNTLLIAHSSDGIFNYAASYTFEVNNTFNKSQTGKVSYMVTDAYNKKVLTDSLSVRIDKNSKRRYNFNIPPLNTGFYRINFMINVSDYDDTTIRVFGIRANEIKSTHQKPEDFDKFWQEAKDELAKVEPDYKMIEKPELEKENRKVYLVEMKSLGNVTVRAWLTEPAKRPKYHKLSVLVGFPGYQITLSPFIANNDDLAFIDLDVRGQGESKDYLNIRKEDYIVYRIEDKNKYIMRGIIMDCIRCIDFICARPEFNHDNILVTGGSMGGYLSITTAALDKRVKICAPQNPLFSDFYNLANESTGWPIDRMKKYVTIKPGLTFKTILDNFQYYDAKNFADEIKCPVLLGIGLLDNLAPPPNAFVLYNSINSKKKIMIFKDLGHEVGKSYENYKNDWTLDTFGLF